MSLLSNLNSKPYSHVVETAKRQAVSYIDNLEKRGILGNFKHRNVPITVENVHKEVKKEVNITGPIVGRVLSDFFRSEGINYEKRRTSNATVYDLELPLSMVYTWKRSLI